MRKFPFFFIFALFILLFLLLREKVRVIALPTSSEEEASFKGIKTLKIVVSQSNEPTDAVVPYEKKVSRLFELAGVRVVPANVRDYDALLTIEVKGKARGRNYERGGFLYTGAKISGSITLEKGRKRIAERFSIDYTPWDISPLELSESYKEIYSTPSKALASYAFGAQHGLGEKLAVLCYKLFGLKPLLLALQDKDRDIVSLASWGLAEVKDPSAVAPLSELLRDKEKPKELRWRAVWVLGEIGNPSASPALLEMLNEEDMYIRNSAIEALGKVKAGDAVEPLLALLKEAKEVSLKELLIEALGNTGDPRAVDALAGFLTASEVPLRHTAIHSLSKIKCQRSAELLLPLLRDKEMNLEAKEGLANLGASAVPVLLNALKTAPNISKVEIGEIFRFRLKDPLAIAPLLSALKDEESIVRQYAVAGLVSIGKASIEPLIIFLREEKDPKARGAAASALRAITKQDLGSNPDEWQKWWEENKEKAQPHSQQLY